MSTLQQVAPGKSLRMCVRCGATREVAERYRGSRLICHGECHRQTQHDRVDSGFGDYRERLNRQQDSQIRALVASERMLDQLGIRLDREPLGDVACKMWSERGPGWATYGIKLDVDLPIARQVYHLKGAWQYLLPVAEERWLAEESWHPCDDDPQVLQHNSLVWEKSEADRA